ncbi:MAG: cupin domain-containing protein [Myxococcota bacterium]
MKPIRRVVTGHAPDGRSTFLFDSTIEPKPTPTGVAIAELWATAEAPASNAASEDAARQGHSLLPDPSGTLLRIFDVEPQDPNTDLGFHTTHSVDYIYVIRGEIHALVDDGERLLREGDVLVQRGTHHAWSNRSGKPCRLLAVMIDAEAVAGANR